MAGRIMVSEEQVRQYAERYRNMPYALGHNDCFLFVLRWASRDLRRLYKYHGAKEALGVLNAHSVDKSCHLLDRHFNRTTEPKTGDLCGWTDEPLGTCGIVLSDGLSLSINQELGLVETTDQPELYWSVEHG